MVWAAVAGAVACHLSPVRVGAVLPLTGALAPYGLSLSRGALLAAQQVNASGGIEGRRLELLVVDSASSPEAAAKLFQQLVVEERVPAVVGGASTAECLAKPKGSHLAFWQIRTAENRWLSQIIPKLFQATRCSAKGLEGRNRWASKRRCPPYRLR